MQIDDSPLRRNLFLWERRISHDAQKTFILRKNKFKFCLLGKSHEICVAPNNIIVWRIENTNSFYLYCGSLSPSVHLTCLHNNMILCYLDFVFHKIGILHLHRSPHGIEILFIEFIFSLMQRRTSYQTMKQQAIWKIKIMIPYYGIFSPHKQTNGLFGCKYLGHYIWEFEILPMLSPI